MLKHSLSLLAIAVLATTGCDRIDGAPAPAGSQPAASEAAAEQAAGAAWAEFMGVWAPPGDCDNDLERWLLRADEFQRYEMHCRLQRLELLHNGVRAISECLAEGYDDGVDDVFWFERGANATLSIIHEANDAVNDGLVMCGKERP